MKPSAAVVLARVLDNVDAAGDCWVWTAAVDDRGYGRFHWPITRVTWRAHRLLWTLLIGPIPSDRELDHLCRNKACVNPDHLEPVTHRENMRRSPITPMAKAAAQTQCRKGHALSGDNVLRTSQGFRECRECRREWQRAYHRRPEVLARRRARRLEAVA